MPNIHQSLTLQDQLYAGDVLINAKPAIAARRKGKNTTPET
ncbi:hypothetical protein PRUB_b0282 [Pseudoalteromonas rubra]|uniref:Uncharacterized protein n=1 Tax=Pseudoalteromonas rubra TaxID=43658 RepID=A0A8T0C1M6_9GAMM|nr:hypothetical protein PRUB_b0282 [Pseudoalteromonas rubra]